MWARSVKSFIDTSGSWVVEFDAKIMGGTRFGVQSTNANNLEYSMVWCVRGGGYLQFQSSTSNVTATGTSTGQTTYDYVHYKFLCQEGTIKQYLNGTLYGTTTGCDWLNTECYILLSGWSTTNQSGTTYVKNLKIKHYSEA